MKHLRPMISKFLTGFFFIFGVCEFLFFIRGCFPHHSGLSGTNLFETLLCIGISLVLTISHRVISSEFLDQYVSVKFRAVICAIFCAGTLGVFTVYYGIPPLAVTLLGAGGEPGATTVWVVSFALSFAAAALLYWVMERRFFRIGKTYDSALAAYKRNGSEKSGIDGLGNQ